MARIRTIKPEFWKHEDLSALPEMTHMLAAALLGYADDEGYFNANPALVKSECLPLRESSLRTQDSLNQLVEIGYIKVGKGDDGKRYGRIVKFDEHQRVNRPTPSKIKKIGIAWEHSSTNHEQLSEDSLPERKGTGKGKEGNGEKQARSSAEADDASAQVQPDPSLTLVGSHPADLKARRSERLAQVTADAIETFNASTLTKSNGGLVANVSPTVGREKRQQQVTRCIRTARAICREMFGSETITPEFWETYWAAVARDDHASGRSGGGKDHPNWTPDFEYLTREATMLKIYDREAAEDAA